MQAGALTGASKSKGRVEISSDSSDGSSSYRDEEEGSQGKQGQDRECEGTLKKRFANTNELLEDLKQDILRARQ